MYCSRFTPEALGDVKRLPKNVRNSLKQEFEDTIQVDPIGCSVPSSGDLGQYRSFHHDDYRVIYQVFEDLKAIAVVGVGKKDVDHHAEIYQQLERLARSGELAATVLKTYRSLSNKPKS